LAGKSISEMTFCVEWTLNVNSSQSSYESVFMPVDHTYGLIPNLII